MKTLSAAGYQLALFGEETQEARPVLYLHAFPGEGEQIWARTRREYVLIAVTGLDWNRDLSPWPAVKAFANGEDFAGGGEAYLHTLTEELLPQAEAMLPFAVTDRGIVGYSLAGLFAVCTMYQGTQFSRVGAMSGSLWYDGWLAYALNQPLAAHPRIYLSLGSKEHRVRSARMSAVKQCTDALAAHWQKSCPVRYDQEPGGHFTDPLGRVSRGIDRLLEM